MPHVEFTSQLAQHVDCPANQTVPAGTLEELLETMFKQYPALRDYIMQENGELQNHVSILSIQSHQSAIQLIFHGHLGPDLTFSLIYVLLFHNLAYGGLCLDTD